MDYSLLPYDAVHAAAAVALQVDAIAALDGDFARLPADVLPILTSLNHVRRFRSVRP